MIGTGSLDRLLAGLGIGPSTGWWPRLSPIDDLPGPTMLPESWLTSLGVGFLQVVSIAGAPRRRGLKSCWTGKTWLAATVGALCPEGPGTWWEWAGTQACGATRLLQVKSVKPCLKQLQQCIQTISTLHDDEILPSNPADLFHWLPKEHMCVLVYLVSL